jgi:hypothetical protein
MKKRNLVSIFLLVLLSGLLSTGCEPVEGPKGEKGDKGDQGEGGSGYYSLPLSDILTLQRDWVWMDNVNGQIDRGIEIRFSKGTDMVTPLITSVGNATITPLQDIPFGIKETSATAGEFFLALGDPPSWAWPLVPAATYKFDPDKGTMVFTDVKDAEPEVFGTGRTYAVVNTDWFESQLGTKRAKFSYNNGEEKGVIRFRYQEANKSVIQLEGSVFEKLSGKGPANIETDIDARNYAVFGDALYLMVPESLESPGSIEKIGVLSGVKEGKFMINNMLFETIPVSITSKIIGTPGIKKFQELLDEPDNFVFEINDNITLNTGTLTVPANKTVNIMSNYTLQLYGTNFVIEEGAVIKGDKKQGTATGPQILIFEKGEITGADNFYDADKNLLERGGEGPYTWTLFTDTGGKTVSGWVRYNTNTTI